MDKHGIKILLVDDEEDILDFVSYNLRKEGFSVSTVNNGVDAIRLAQEFKPHLVILDVMMPGMDGIETCREIRRLSSLHDTLIIFFTARGENFTQITGLDAGGDDYIIKPIQPSVLISKVNSLLRRHVSLKEEEMIIEVGDLKIDRLKYMVTRSGKQIQLAHKEFELLVLLAASPGRAFTRDEIFEKIWEDDVVVGERTIDVHIRRIREKIGDDNIMTIKGVGYKFVI